jgi:integrase
MGKEPHPEHALEMQKIVERYYRSYFQSALLCKIDEETLQKFLVHLKHEKHLSGSTINSIRNAAIKALRYAKRKKIIRNFDFDSVLRAGGKAKERGILEREEIDKLLSLQWASLRSYITVLIAANTGMRMGEIRALRVCDIHENRISVRHSWGRKSNLKCTKNQETREIPILPSLYDEIMDYIRKMGLYQLGSFLIPGNKPEIPYNNRQIGKDFNNMLNQIGIDDKTRKERGIVFHSWRHLMANRLAQNSANKTIGMKILGLKTSRIFDHYASHIDKETFKQMTAVIENVLQPDSPKEPIPFRGINKGLA